MIHWKLTRIQKSGRKSQVLTQLNRQKKQEEEQEEEEVEEEGEGWGGAEEQEEVTARCLQSKVRFPVPPLTTITKWEGHFQNRKASWRYQDPAQGKQAPLYPRQLQSLWPGASSQQVSFLEKGHQSYVSDLQSDMRCPPSQPAHSEMRSAWPVTQSLDCEWVTVDEWVLSRFPGVSALWLSIPGSTCGTPLLVLVIIFCSWPGCWSTFFHPVRTYLKNHCYFLGWVYRCLSCACSC